MTRNQEKADSPGVDALVGFNIEGDAGGEDSQIQSLWLYQTFGTLPSKEYYEEKPILDLYQSVIAGILTSIAEHTGSQSNSEKRDYADDVAEVFEVAGWPWPWPGDDKPDDKPKPPPKQDDPLSERMYRLAAKVVAFERDLVRAGADLEYLFNPHYAYNPYPTSKVDKALSFLDVRTYLSTYAPRTFPANITVTYPPYLKAVSKIVDQTPDHVLAGYFVSRVAVTFADVLGPKVEVRKEMRRLQEVLKGIKKGTEENRVDLCLNYVDGIVGFIAGREFVKEAFSPEAKKEGETIINGQLFPGLLRRRVADHQTLSMRSTTSSLISHGWTRNPPRPRKRRPKPSFPKWATRLRPTRPTRRVCRGGTGAPKSRGMTSLGMCCGRHWRMCRGRGCHWAGSGTGRLGR